MPATATHAFFAEDIYEELDNQYKDIIKNDKQSFLMFSQSMDSMMFYNITNLKKGKKLRNLSNTFHTKNINQYFTNLLHYVKKNKYYYDPQTLAYIYGIICHYSLDTTLHPYIFYKTGLFDKTNKDTLKYNSLHNYMETYIDNIMIEKRGYHYKDFNFKNFCFDFKKFSKSLNHSIQYSFKTTYDIDHMDKIYYKSLKQMCLFLQLFRLDKYGIKKHCYQVLNHFIPKNTIQLDCLSYYKVEDKFDYLNRKKMKWFYPADNSIESTKDFFELYHEALQIALQIIDEVNHYFFHQKPMNINNLFKNKSYLTGLDCDKNLKPKYFEF